MGDAGLRQLGDVVGSDAEGVRVVIDREHRALPLGAVYFLEREAATSEITFEPVSPPDPRKLLTSTFNFAVASPERLTRMLEVCSRIACRVPTFRALAPAGAGPDVLAEAIYVHDGLTGRTTP
jgi:hypothetical protein